MTPEAPAQRPIRVVVTGGESTGKTTLAAALARQLGTLWVPEYSRDFARLAQRPLAADDVTPIAQGQLAREDAAERAWHERYAAAADAPPLVLDTDVLSTVVYARHYYASCPAWVEAAARERRGTLYLLCAPDLPWEPDGVRDRPSARAEMHTTFAETLGEFGVTLAHVHGIGEARTARALAALAAHGVHPAKPSA